MSFKSLGLSESLVKAVHAQGYDSPTPIQTKAIPSILQGRDVLASAQTGTGKTAGFTLPMLQLLSTHSQKNYRSPRALVLTPTRELAAQVHKNVKDYGKFERLKSTVIFGGVSQKSQVASLNSGIDILIATPGRLLDLNNQGLLSLKHIEILVLDEADRMLDMGFLRDIKKIMAVIPEKKQTLLFSATFSKDIRNLANQLLKDPVSVESTPENTTVEAIEQQVYRVAKAKKTDLLIKLIKDGNWDQVLVFTRTKHGANKLTKKLEAADISAAPIHGNKSQTARTNALAGFKNGKIKILVATDIASRGLDIPLLPHVVNFELPNVSEDYVHRIGRTGRAGASGLAVSLVSADETLFLRDIEKLIGTNIPKDIVSGFEPDPNASTEPYNPQKQKNRRNFSSKKNSGKNKRNFQKSH
jgi:ATP-dependent RNA helicase RhlE